MQRFAAEWQKRQTRCQPAGISVVGVRLILLATLKILEVNHADDIERYDLGCCCITFWAYLFRTFILAIIISSFYPIIHFFLLLFPYFSFFPLYSFFPTVLSFYFFPIISLFFSYFSFFPFISFLSYSIIPLFFPLSPFFLLLSHFCPIISLFFPIISL